MSHLLAYLTAHGLFPTITVPTHHAYLTFHAHCAAHHFLTGWAQFKNHVVAYCYRGNK